MEYGEDALGELFIIRFGEIFDDSNNGGWGLYIVNGNAWSLFTNIIQDTNYHHYALVMQEGESINQLKLYQDGNKFDVTYSDFQNNNDSPNPYEINTGNSIPIKFGSYPAFTRLIKPIYSWQKIVINKTIK